VPDFTDGLKQGLLRLLAAFTWGTLATQMSKTVEEMFVAGLTVLPWKAER
jgi:hypothetical protein